MVVTLVTVIYMFKNDSGFLVEKSKEFYTHTEAMSFIKSIRSLRLVGNVVMDIKEQREKT